MKLLTLLLLVTLTLQSSEIYVFTSSSCEPCVARLNVAKELNPDAEFIVYDVSVESNLNLFFEVEHVLNISFTPLPLFIMFRGGELSLIAAGGLSKEDWLSFHPNASQVNVYVESGLGGVVLEKTLTGEEASKLRDTILKGAPPKRADIALILTAALLDAFNPCMLGFFLILLTLLSYSKNTLGSGLAFVAAVYATRLAIGAGLLHVLSVPQLRPIILSAAFILGFMKTLQSIIGGRQIPAGVAEKITGQIERASAPTSSFIAGIIVSTLLVTCNSPAYLLALSLIPSGEVAPLLAYNLLIIMPLIILTINFYSIEGLRKKVSAKRRLIDFLTGVGIMVITLISQMG